MLNILEMTLPELTQWVTGDLGLPKFRAQQIWQWVWQRMARSFDEMTNISKPVREELSKKAQIVWPEVDKIQTSSDSTTKFLLRLGDGERVETVLIPSTSREGNVRWTQCLSTQVGCPMHCTFCSTGTMGFTRNMTMGEILGQILVARDYLGDTRPQWPVLRNLVFMGMGEPLLNFENLERALKSLNEDGGLNFAPTQELRQKIMPGAAKWPLEELLKTLNSYPLKTRERITFEYLLLGGVNDGPEQARQLINVVRSVRKSKINLIVYNPSEGALYKAPTQQRILAFEKILWDAGITAVIRKSKGQDIDAACGQLKVRAEKEEGQTPGEPA